MDPVSESLLLSVVRSPRISEYLPSVSRSSCSTESLLLPIVQSPRAGHLYKPKIFKTSYEVVRFLNEYIHLLYDCKTVVSPDNRGFSITQAADIVYWMCWLTLDRFVIDAYGINTSSNRRLFSKIAHGRQVIKLNNRFVEISPKLK